MFGLVISVEESVMIANTHLDVGNKLHLASITVVINTQAYMKDSSRFPSKRNLLPSVTLRPSRSLTAVLSFLVALLVPGLVTISVRRKVTLDEVR